MKSSATTHCLVRLLDFIYCNLEKHKTSVAPTFVDITKPFDLVNNNVIIKKAIDLGPQGSLVSWLADSLLGRYQIVRFRGAISTSPPQTFGTLQVTKMEPLCILILITDALKDTNHHLKYVDDSTLGITISNNSLDFSALQHIIINP
ncbi:uncharacterized protein [Panulirus ornatus]|uniref:uncharacterized protein n=1 Tax=Panulirus ornatus TaxID=150431 RepID=UPI003A868F7E